jgi:hypothetical protein
MAQRSRRPSLWGSAILALPLLLYAGHLAAARGNVIHNTTPEKAHLDGGARWMVNDNGTVDAAARQLGLPLVGGQWFLWGGGATLTRPHLHLQASAWTGGLRAEQGDNSAAWDLQLAELALEQSYLKGPLLLTGGATANHAQLYGLLSSPAGHSSVRAPLWGGSVTLGARWPRGTALGFYTRAAYLWLSGQGDWRGDQAALLGSQRFDLSGPSVTGQVELAF